MDYQHFLCTILKQYNFNNFFYKFLLPSEAFPDAHHAPLFTYKGMSTKLRPQKLL